MYYDLLMEVDITVECLVAKKWCLWVGYVAIEKVKIDSGKLKTSLNVKLANFCSCINWYRVQKTISPGFGHVKNWHGSERDMLSIPNYLESHNPWWFANFTIFRLHFWTEGGISSSWILCKLKRWSSCT